jgi:hypothetical protein
MSLLMLIGPKWLPGAARSLALAEISLSDLLWQKLQLGFEKAMQILDSKTPWIPCEHPIPAG